MADRISPELTVGVFNDNLLSTQLDTQERINSMYNADFNVPEVQHSYVPKEYSTDDILKSPDLPKIKDYLSSSDPKQNQLATDYMNKQYNENKNLKTGIGMPNLSKYQPGQEKFTDTHWYNGSGKAKYGFNPDKSVAENEDFYSKAVWNNYSIFGKIWRGTGQFIGRTLAKIGTGLVGTVGDIGSMAWNGLQEGVEAAGGPQNNFWADVSDNFLSRKMQEADDYVKQEMLPTYKTLNYDNKGVFSKLSDPYFWTNDIADGAGFMLQFAIPAIGIGKLGLAAKAGKLGNFARVALGTEIGGAVDAGKFAKGAGWISQTLTGARNGAGIAAHVFNTTMESVAEAKDGFQQTVKDLTDKGYSEQEAKNIAAQSAPGQFWANMGILSFSNALENKWFQNIANKGVFKSLSHGVDEAGFAIPKSPLFKGTGKLANIANATIFYGKESAKAAIMEGWWEENAQLAAQRVAEGSYMRRGEDTLSQGRYEKAIPFWKQLMRQTVDSAKSKDIEAQDNILAGVVVGVLGGAAMNKLAGSRNIPLTDQQGNPILNEDGTRATRKSFLPEGERKKERRENAEIVATVKNARDAWLSVNLMPYDLFNQNENGEVTINEAKAKERLEEVNSKLSKVASISQRKMTIDELTNGTQRENMQHLVFADYVKAHILNGTGTALLSRLQNWGNKSKDELAMYGVTPEIAEDPQYWASFAKTMHDEYSKVDKLRFINPVNPVTNKQESTDSYFAKEQAIKSHVYDYIAYRETAKRTAAKYRELSDEFNPFNKTVTPFNSYNEMVAQKLTLQATLDNNKELSEDDRKGYQDTLNALNFELETRQRSLPEGEKGRASEFLFEKGSNIAEQESDIWKNINDYLSSDFNAKDFAREEDHADEQVKYWSNEDAITKWNSSVAMWETALRKTQFTKLKNLGFDEAEVTTMTPEERQKLIANNTTKEQLDAQQAKVAEEAPPDEGKIKSFLKAMTTKTLSAMKGAKEYVKDKLGLSDEATTEQIQEAIATQEEEQKQSELPSPTTLTMEQLRDGINEIAMEIGGGIIDPKKFDAVVRAMIVSPDFVIQLTDYQQGIVKEYIERINTIARAAIEEGRLAHQAGERIVVTDTGDVNLQPTGTATVETPDVGNIIDTVSNDVSNPDKVEADLIANLDPMKIKQAIKEMNEMLEYDKDLKVSQIEREMAATHPVSFLKQVADQVNTIDFTGEDQGVATPAGQAKMLYGAIIDIAQDLFPPKVMGTAAEVRPEAETPPLATDNIVSVPAPTPSETSGLLEEVRQAYRLHEKSLENDTTFKQEAEKEGLLIQNNKIDDFVNTGKNTGDINIITANPKDIEGDKLKTNDVNITRFNFLDNLLSGKLDKNNFKMVLRLSKKGNIVGIVGDTKGNIQFFDKEGMPSKEGVYIEHWLDYEMYETPNISKRREDVVTATMRFAPLTAIPITLHRDFVDKNIIEMLKDKIRRSLTTASMVFVTQGLLYREGITNSYGKLPHNKASHSASDVYNRGHMRNRIGEIPLEDSYAKGVYRRARRIQFFLRKDVDNEESEVEVVEFHPRTIGEITNSKGDNIFNTLKTEDGKNFFQAAIEGNLLSNAKNFETLTSLLRPDQFKVLDLGSHLLVVNLKKFKQYLTSDDVSIEQLRKTTTLKDIEKSDLNFNRDKYQLEGETNMHDDVTGGNAGEYTDFINNNVFTSTLPITKGQVRGFARVNKRIALTLDDNMEEMAKIENQREEENRAPGVTELTIGNELEDQEFLNILLKEDDEIEENPEKLTEGEC